MISSIQISTPISLLFFQISAVPSHVLEQIDEVINDVISGAGVIPQDLSATTNPPPIPVQIVPLTQPKLQAQHMITPHHPYVQQAQQPPPPHQPSTHDWSNYQQQPTLNIATATVRTLPSYPHYHPQQQQQHHHDLLPATTNVINTAGVPQHEQQQIVAERISSILASSPHEQQQTTVTQAPIQIKRAWPMNQHQPAESHFLGKHIQHVLYVSNAHSLRTDFFSHGPMMTIAVNGDGEFQVIKAKLTNLFQSYLLILLSHDRR